MRSQALSTLAGVWCLAAIAAAAPSPNLDAADTCAPSISTVFLTATPSTSTVTVHDAPPISTVYITEHTTVQVSQVLNPTSTLTAISTFYTTTIASETRTIPTSDNDHGAAVASVVTASYGQASSSPEVISYYVESGITHYLDGQTPNPSDSTVYLTGVVTVTVEPIYTASSAVVSSSSVESIPTAPGIVVLSSSVEPTTTVYAHTTITTSEETTLTATLSAKSTYSAGSSLSFTGIGPGGWNKSSTASIASGASGTVGTILASQSGFGVTSLSSLSLVISSSYDIYSPHSVSQLTSLAAESGLQATPTIATPVYASTDSDASASAIGAQDTSLSHSSVKAYTTSNLSSTNGGASAPAPYGNSTISSSSPPASGSASGVYTSPGSASFSTVYTSAPIGLNSTSSASAVSTKSSIGPVSTTGSSNTSVVLPYSVYHSSTFSSSATAALNASSAVTSSLSPSSSQISSSASKGSNATSVASSATQSTSQISSSTYTHSNGTSTAASAAPTDTSSCGLTGDFTLNFDDLPPLVVGKGIDPNTIQPMPLFNPYDKFDFSNGFLVVPPPTDPYLPESAPFLLQFVPNFNISGTDENGPHGPNTKELGYSADFAGADRGATGCFNFHFYGAALGCDSRGPDCEFTFTGFHKDSATGKDVPFTSQDIAVPACPPLADCVLTPVTLDDTFSDLTKVRMNVTVASRPKIWWMDDVRLGWFDNSCDKGKCRRDAHVH